jgi:large conductance mechanosensitive channel
MGFIKEFKEFAVRGNLVDTAVAFVMGAAFGKIVSSFVEGIVMPMVGMLTGGVDFNDKKLILQDAVAEIKNADGTIIPAVAEVSIKYGVFITNLIDFIIVAFAVFHGYQRNQFYEESRTCATSGWPFKRREIAF